MPQIIANIRGLIFIGYPFEKIKAKLMKKKETFTFMQLLKINELILNYFNETFFQLIEVAKEDKKVFVIILINIFISLFLSINFFRTKYMWLKSQKKTQQNQKDVKQHQKRKQNNRI